MKHTWGSRRFMSRAPPRSLLLHSQAPGPTLAIVGQRWPALAVMGLCWPLWFLWACIGLRWPSLAFWVWFGSGRIWWW